MGSFVLFLSKKNHPTPSAPFPLTRVAALPTLSKEARERAGLDELSVTEYDLHLGYEYFNAEQILRKMLPAGVEVPGSFETVGHIAHLNLRDEVAEFKHMIGRVLLDKNPRWGPRTA